MQTKSHKQHHTMCMIDLRLRKGIRYRSTIHPWECSLPVQIHHTDYSSITWRNVWISSVLLFCYDGSSLFDFRRPQSWRKSQEFVLFELQNADKIVILQTFSDTFGIACFRLESEDEDLSLDATEESVGN